MFKKILFAIIFCSTTSAFAKGYQQGDLLILDGKGGCMITSPKGNGGFNALNDYGRVVVVTPEEAKNCSNFILAPRPSSAAAKAPVFAEETIQTAEAAQ